MSRSVSRKHAAWASPTNGIPGATGGRDGETVPPFSSLGSASARLAPRPLLEVGGWFPVFGAQAQPVAVGVRVGLQCGPSPAPAAGVISIRRGPAQAPSGRCAVDVHAAGAPGSRSSRNQIRGLRPSGSDQVPVAALAVSHGTEPEVLKAVRDPGCRCPAARPGGGGEPRRRRNPRRRTPAAWPGPRRAG